MTRREAVAALAKEPQSFDLIWWCIPIGAHEEAMDIVTRLSQLASRRKAMGYTRLKVGDNDSVQVYPKPGYRLKILRER